MRKTLSGNRPALDQSGQRKKTGKPVAGAPSHAGLAREQLVEVALVLLQEEGLDALSTRRLAHRLGVKSPALYWHVSNKSELLGLLADAICAQMQLPSRRFGFRRRLQAIGQEYRRVLLSYRDAPRLFAEQAPTGPHRIKLYDVAVGAFLDAGFAAPEAVAMATFYRHYLLGMITEEARLAQRAHDGGAPHPAVALGLELTHLKHRSSDYPNLSGAVALLTAVDPAALFQSGLDVLLDGMACRVP